MAEERVLHAGIDRDSYERLTWNALSERLDRQSPRVQEAGRQSDYATQR
jgi:hypothetical protein